MELEVLLETDDKTTVMVVQAQEVPDIICIKDAYYKVVASHQWADDAVSVICKPAKLLLLLMPSKPTLLNFEKCK